MEKRLFLLINRVQHHLFSKIDKELEARFGISYTQVTALFAFRAEQGLQMKDFSHALQLKNSAITGLAARMEKNGLIVRKPCPEDGRASLLFLTEKGQDIRAKALPLLADANEKLKAGFDEAEMEVVYRFLNHVLDDF